MIFAITAALSQRAELNLPAATDNPDGETRPCIRNVIARGHASQSAVSRSVVALKDATPLRLAIA
jgi:hypothetical protein